MDKFNFDIVPLYVKDISHSKIISSSRDGLLVGGRTPVMFHGWEEVDKISIDELEKELAQSRLGKELSLEVGLTKEVVNSRMKTCDLLVMGKTEVLSEKVIDILKDNYKSILLIGEQPLSAMENVAIANDDGVKVNRSCYHFTEMFRDITHFTSLTINKELEENLLKGYLLAKGKTVTDKLIKYDNYDEVIAHMSEYDLIVMGNLSKSYFFEKIIGKNGAKLLENVKEPVFIG